jgi:ubiquinone/menaquinone biosynthesis C-methylase UbiE
MVRWTGLVSHSQKGGWNKIMSNNRCNMIRNRRTLSHEEARAVYDRVGRNQDCHRFYEDPVTQKAVCHANLTGAKSVFEFGCGTGRFAEMLLDHHLPTTAYYVGVDASRTMVSLASRRLTRFGNRARVRLTDGSPRLDFASASFDRFLSNYVLDLLSVEDIRAVLAEAHRILAPESILAAVGLTHGFTFTSHAFELAVLTIHAVRPVLVGGCRPLDLLEFIGEPKWRIRDHKKVTAFTVPSQVVVAQKIEAAL